MANLNTPLMLAGLIDLGLDYSSTQANENMLWDFTYIFVVRKALYFI